MAWPDLSVMIMVCTAGCSSTSADTSDVQVELALKPPKPVVGTADVSLQLADAGGAAVRGADVRLEGNMNHAGMKPSFSELQETQPGTYTGTLEFTMAGDWFILVSATTPDGRRIERKIDVPQVKSP